MTWDDRRIDDLLEPDAAVLAAIPYPGHWHRPPFVELDGAAVLATDDGLTQIVVDRESGVVSIVDGDGRSLVNSSLEQLVQCSREYLRALEAVRLIDASADEDIDRVGAELESTLRAVDTVALDDENAFWSVAAEELGYGLSGGGEPDSPQIRAAYPNPSWESVLAGRPIIVSAAGPQHRLDELHAGGWRTVETAADLVELDDPATLASFLVDRGAGADAADRRVAIVITTADTSPLSAAVVSAVPGLAIVCHVGDDAARVVPPEVSEAGVTVHVLTEDAPGVRALGDIVLRHMITT